MVDKGFDTWRARWARIKRGWELVFSTLFLLLSVLLSVAILPELPSITSRMLAGNGDAAQFLFIYIAFMAVSVLQFRWRTAFYPQLRRNASAALNKHLERNDTP